MLSSKDNVSSKRFLGIICFIIYFIIFGTTYWILLTPIQVSMANQILYVGGALITGGIFEKIILNKNNKLNKK